MHDSVPRLRHARLLLLLLVLGFTLHEVLHVGDLAGLVEHAGPALLLLAPLLIGRYPGERVLARLAVARRQTPGRAVRHTPRRRPVFLRRRAPLIAEHLATRPPPGLAGAHAA